MVPYRTLKNPFSLVCMYRGHTGVASDPREYTLVMEDSLRGEPRIPVSVASVVQSDLVGAQEVGSVWKPRRFSGDTVLSDRTAHTGCRGR